MASKSKLVLSIKNGDNTVAVETTSRKAAIAIRDQLNATEGWKAGIMLVKEVE